MHAEEIIFNRDLIKTTDIDLNELSKAAIFVTPIGYEFSSENWEEMRDGGWQSIEAVECETCGAVYVVRGFSMECENEECERHGETIAEDLGPMMSYYYPLDMDIERSNFPGDEGVRQLVNLPLCVVEIDGNAALALTGGGMDLSWEICEAFMRLGLLPPLHFAGLPAMAGRGENAEDRHIAAACIRSAEAAEEIMGYRTSAAIQSVESALDFANRRR